MYKQLKAAREKESGFTLIELLIVIVILGVLAGIVVFAVSAFNKNGQAAACKSDFKSVEIADEAYFAKNSSTYATSLVSGATGSLVPTYLKEPPSTSNGYTIALTGSGPTVTVGTTTSSDTGACSGLS